ncbi:MAG TPA: amino acid adenylation domain-containing protein [Actinocrinis sp.]|nr:amino acid adenylation domain-containing protein [Actinocrinis sp.]
MTAMESRRFAALGGDQRRRVLRRLVELGRIDQVPNVVPPRDPARPIRLSPAQRDLWVFESLYPDDAALNLCCAYHFDTPVAAADLEAALDVLVEQHDVLRTRLTGTAADLRVEFPPEQPFRLERQDLREDGLPLAGALKDFGRRTFDLGRDRLIRGRLITVDDTRSTLVLALHHIITDWWSFDVLHTEFVEAYQCIRDGRPQTSDRPNVQYADFAGWQSDLEESGIFDAQLSFWRDYLSDPPPALSVGPLDPGADGYGIEQVEFVLDPALAQRVRAFARQHDATVYGVTMTAFAVLAHRLSGQDDLLIGTPTANRAAKGLDRMIGYVMNTVPVRWRFGPQDTFLNLLRGFTTGFPQILANADVPLGRIVTMIGPERLPRRSPLFQWIFMHLAKQESVQALRSISRPERVHTGGEHDIMTALRDIDDGVSGMFAIRTDLYSAEVVRHWAASYETLLDALTADPQAPVRTAALVDARERSRLHARGGHFSPDTWTASLAGLVSRRADRSPDAPALEQAASSVYLSYRELHEQAARLGARMARLGAGPERLVALAMGRTAATVIAALAVEHTGAAFVAVDPDLPAERIARLLADAAPVLLVTDSATAPTLPAYAAATLILDAEQPAETDPDRSEGPVPALADADPRAAAYVNFTSGSTGRPKGVVSTHSGITALSVTMVDGLCVNPEDRVFQISAPNFDIWVAELVAAFGAGATLVIPPTGPLAGPVLAQALAATRSTFVFLPPPLLAGVAPEDCPDLRMVVTGGDYCPADLVRVWAGAGRLHFNVYGPTESTVVATAAQPREPERADPPIGRVIPGTAAYVLDEALQPVPVGAPGEMYLSGLGLARGYLNRPGLTAERFVADPFTEFPGSRMYRTGDLVRRRPDGQFDFLGRTDRQVKLHGLRIEPGEIEAALTAHPSVAQAAVLLREDEPGRKRLVAYLVARPGAQPDTRAVLAGAAAVLSASMVPVAAVWLEQLPLTSRGKLDRAALPVPATESAPAARRPASAREELLCALFADLLGLETVGPDEDFLSLGGDSILAIQLVGRARAAGLAVRPRDVLTARTPAALGALAQPAGPDAEVGQGSDTGPLPLPPMVRWWLDTARPQDRFAMSVLLDVPAGLDLDRIAVALGTLIRRHGALRLRLRRQMQPQPPSQPQPPGEPADGWTLEVAAEAPAPELDRVDAAELDAAALRALAVAAAGEVALSPEDGRLLAARWFDAGPSRPGRLLLMVHHLAVDAVSWAILQADLTELLTTGAPARTAPPTPLRRWAEELDREADRAVDQLSFWESVLADPQAQLAPDRSQRGRRAAVTVTLAADRTEALVSRLPAAFRCTAEDVLLTALLAAAVRWRGQGNRLLINLEGHGRTMPSSQLDLSGTVGWFTCQYPVLLDAGPQESDMYWRDPAEAERALKQVKENLRAVPETGLGYGLLRYSNQKTAPRLAGSAAPQLRFNYLGRIGGKGGDAGRAGSAEMLGIVDHDSFTLTHLVEIDAACVAGDVGLVLDATWSYAQDSFTEDEMHTLAGYWSEALVQLAEFAGGDGFGGTTVSDFPLVALTQQALADFEADLDDFDDLGGLETGRMS